LNYQSVLLPERGRAGIRAAEWLGEYSDQNTSWMTGESVLDFGMNKFILFYGVTMSPATHILTLENSSTIIERLIFNNMEGSGRGPYEGTIPAFTWRD
jgi:hypothetical protein